VTEEHGSLAHQQVTARAVNEVCTNGTRAVLELGVNHPCNAGSMVFPPCNLPVPVILPVPPQTANCSFPLAASNTHRTSAVELDSPMQLDFSAQLARVQPGAIAPTAPLHNANCYLEAMRAGYMLGLTSKLDGSAESSSSLPTLHASSTSVPTHVLDYSSLATKATFSTTATMPGAALPGRNQAMLSCIQGPITCNEGVASPPPSPSLYVKGLPAGEQSSTMAGSGAAPEAWPPELMQFPMARSLSLHRHDGAAAVQPVLALRRSAKRERVP
jgi:hypothetical protein